MLSVSRAPAEAAPGCQSIVGDTGRWRGLGLVAELATRWGRSEHGDLRSSRRTADLPSKSGCGSEVGRLLLALLVAGRDVFSQSRTMVHLYYS